MKHPIYQIERSKVSGHLLVIAANQTEAIARAHRVWEEKGIEPLTERETLSVKHGGTVDYIPSLPVDHIEGK